MAGETDVQKMLATLRVSRRTEPVTLVTLAADDAANLALGNGIEALISEAEGITAVVTVAEAERRGWPVSFVAAWLTLEVHSALEAVGLTAAFSAALGAKSIPCNVLAGFYHDHLLVPLVQATQAIETLQSLASDG